MAKDFSLKKYFKKQYIKEFKSNSQKETDAMRSSTFTSYDEEGEQSYLKESRVDQSKIFDQSEIEEIIGEIREITGILEDRFNSDVEYQEFRFSSGEGGFSFQWSHSRQMGGRFGLSINKDGNYLSAISYYSKKYFGKEKIKSSNTFVQNIETWRDLNNEMLISIWAQLEPMVVQNEINTKAALSAEAKAQADYYGSKAKTGRIGYGLTQQPRMRNEASINDPILVKARAARDQMDKVKSTPKPNFDEVLDLRDEKGDLERRIKNLYREMESDPDVEAEGGPVADQYGDELNKLETRLFKVKKQIKNYDMNEGDYADRLANSDTDSDGRNTWGDKTGYSDKEMAQGKGKLKKYPDKDGRNVWGDKVDYSDAEKKVKGLNEATEKSWNAVDVSRKAEKEIGNKEWNERTTKKLDMLKSLNKAGKFKKDWDEDKLQGWVDKNYSWEKLSQQFKINEGSCGYTPDGKPRSKPAGPDLLKLKEKIFNSLKK